MTILQSQPFYNGLLVAIALIAVLLLTRRKLRRSELWQATLTPLSSIIGSGFLVMAPLLASIVGLWAPVVICGIVLLAYSIGSVIRFNIMHVAPQTQERHGFLNLHDLDYVGKIVLVIAYVIAVAFYLELLSSFSLNYIGIDDPFLERCVTTSIIVFIGLVGYLKGLSGLEKLEMFAMTLQLAVLSALIVGLLVYSVTAFEDGVTVVANESNSVNTKVRMLAGVLLIVQGFETSRFLGEKYVPAIRVQSMRIAQWISGAVFIGSVALLMPVVQTMNLIEINLAEIVVALTPVAVVLPVILMVAAVLSQFSAAVADTGGGGGLLAENSAQRVTTRFGYVCVCVSSILLVWAVELLEIIALASRAFAAYYLIQTIIALVVNQRSVQDRTLLFWLRQVFFSAIALILVYIVAFSIPVE
ncbi:MAG: hypothetical protein OXG25_14565 [Gammaproteobacteria bacterium]|nr:hypothetical protein [Gammaproteobacteria bacterium]